MEEETSIKDLNPQSISFKMKSDIKRCSHGQESVWSRGWLSETPHQGLVSDNRLGPLVIEISFDEQVAAA